MEWRPLHWGAFIEAVLRKTDGHKLVVNQGSGHIKYLDYLMI